MGRLIQISTLARLTVRELTRRRVFYALGLVALLLILLSLVLTELSLGQWGRLIADVGLSSLNLLLDLLAATLGAGLLAGDIERRSIFVVTAAPISRSRIVLGRFIGLALVLWMLLALASVVIAVTLGTVAHQFPPLPYWFACIALGLECAVVAALAVVFSSFSSSLMAGVFSIAFALLGHLSANLNFFASKSASPVTARVGHSLAMILPNLNQFDFKANATYLDPISPASAANCLLAASIYAAAYISLASLIFTKRDLK